MSELMTATVDPVEALRQATREANAALKDLRLEHKALKATLARMEQTRTAVLDTIAEWEQSIQGRVEKAIEASVAGEMNALRAEVTGFGREARDHIMEQFDALGREILDVLGGPMAIAKATRNLGGLSRGALVSVPESLDAVPPALRNMVKHGR